jgi:hypothetical protein
MVSRQATLLVRAAGPEFGLAAFGRCDRADGVFETPRFLGKPDPAQFADQLRPILRYDTPNAGCAFFVWQHAFVSDCVSVTDRDNWSSAFCYLCFWDRPLPNDLVSVPITF